MFDIFNMLKKEAHTAPKQVTRDTIIGDILDKMCIRDSQRPGRLAAAAPEPFLPGIFRLRAAVCHRGAGAAAPWPPDAEQGLRWRQSRAPSCAAWRDVYKRQLRQKAGSAAMGANKNGQRIMCSVICTPNRENPSAYVPTHLREHPAVQSQYRCGNCCRRSRTCSAQHDPCNLHAGL